MAESSFGQFVGDSLPALMRHAYALTGDAHAGEDLVQDTLVRLAGVDLQLGHSLMLWVDGQGRLAYGGWSRKYWTSADGGVSWQESPTLRDVNTDGSIGTFGPGDTLTFLASAPPDGIAPKKTTRNPLVPASDGSFWAACTPDPCVRVTRDHGATWQAVSTVDGVTTVDRVATADGRTVFAAVRTQPGSGAATTPKLLRSGDGGVTWTAVLDLPQLSADGVARPDGDLILSLASEQGGVYRLKAGASTLQRLADAPAHPNALYLSGGVVVAAAAWNQGADPNLGSVVSVSTDGGTTWDALPAP